MTPHHAASHRDLYPDGDMNINEKREIEHAQHRAEGDDMVTGVDPHLHIVVKDVKNMSDVCYQHMTDDQMRASGLTEDEITQQDWVRTAFGWRRGAPITKGIATLFKHVGLVSITEDNLEEWVYRAEALYDAGVAILTILTEDKEGNPLSIPYTITRADLTSHINTYCANPPDHWPIPDEAFDAYIRQLRSYRQRRSLLKDGNATSPSQAIPTQPETDSSSG